MSRRDYIYHHAINYRYASPLIAPNGWIDSSTTLDRPRRLTEAGAQRILRAQWKEHHSGLGEAVVTSMTVTKVYR